jgi:hypothetical protein
VAWASSIAPTNLTVRNGQIFEGLNCLSVCAIEAHHDFPSTALTDSARSALFRTVLAVLAVFACMTGIGTRAGRGKKTFPPGKCGEHDDQGQKEGREAPFINHRAFSSDAVSCTSEPD